MKNTRARLASRYLVALRGHLAADRSSGGSRARKFGQAAVACGLASTELARLHARALRTLAPGPGAAARYHRASVFFKGVLAPLELDRRAVRETNRHLRQHNETLRRHTAALAEGNRRLQREIV